MPRPILALGLLLAAILAVGLGACGGDDGEDAEEPAAAVEQDAGDGAEETTGDGSGGGDEQAVEAALREYFAAYADGDAERLCESFTPSSREQVEEAAAQSQQGGGQGKDASCAQLLDRAIASGAAPGEQFDDAEVTAVEIDGDKATATYKLGDTPGGSMPLEREDGEWGIAFALGTPPEADK